MKLKKVSALQPEFPRKVAQWKGTLAFDCVSVIMKGENYFLFFPLTGLKVLFPLPLAMINAVIPADKIQ